MHRHVIQQSIFYILYNGTKQRKQHFPARCWLLFQLSSSTTHTLSHLRHFTVREPPSLSLLPHVADLPTSLLALSMKAHDVLCKRHHHITLGGVGMDRGSWHVPLT